MNLPKKRVELILLQDNLGIINRATVFTGENTMHTAELKISEFVNVNGSLCAIGKIFSDSKGRFANGDGVMTSAIEQIDMANRVIITRNSTYKILED